MINDQSMHQPPVCVTFGLVVLGGYFVRVTVYGSLSQQHALCDLVKLPTRVGGHFVSLSFHASNEGSAILDTSPSLSLLEFYFKGL